MSIEDVIRVMRAADGDTALIIVGWFVTGLLALAAAFVRRGIWLAAFLCVVAAGGLGGTFTYARFGLGGTSSGAAVPRFDPHSDKVLIGGVNLTGPTARAAAATAEECKTRCAADGRCQAYTYDPMFRMCELKAVVGTLQTFKGAVSGIRRGAGQASRK